MNMTNTRTVLTLFLAGVAMALALTAPQEAQAACRTVRATSSAPTEHQAARHAQRQVLDSARQVSRSQSSGSSRRSPLGVARIVTTCRPGERTTCTASVLICP